MPDISLTHIVGLVIGALLVVTGLSLIFHERKLRPEERERLREIDIFGIKLKSSRAFLLIALGAVLAIMSPFVESYFTQSQENQSASKGSRPMGEKPVATVQDLENIDPGEFEVIKDLRIFDLRSRKQVPEKRKEEKISQVLQTRYTLLKKTKETDVIRYRFATTGADVEARSLTHEYQASQLLDLEQQTVNRVRNLKKILELAIDVSTVPVGEQFLIINEANYWNAFQGEEAEWAGAITQYKTHELGLLLLFSKEKAYTHFAKFATPGDSKNKKRFKGIDREYASQQSLYWVIKNPKPKVAYEIEWRW